MTASEYFRPFFAMQPYLFNKYSAFSKILINFVYEFKAV